MESHVQNSVVTLKPRGFKGFTVATIIMAAVLAVGIFIALLFLKDPDSDVPTVVGLLLGIVLGVILAPIVTYPAWLLWRWWAGSFLPTDGSNEPSDVRLKKFLKNGAYGFIMCIMVVDILTAIIKLDGQAFSSVPWSYLVAPLALMFLGTAVKQFFLDKQKPETPKEKSSSHEQSRSSVEFIDNLLHVIIHAAVLLILWKILLHFLPVTFVPPTPLHDWEKSNSGFITNFAANLIMMIFSSGAFLMVLDTNFAFWPVSLLNFAGSIYALQLLHKKRILSGLVVGLGLGAMSWYVISNGKIVEGTLFQFSTFAAIIGAGFGPPLACVIILALAVRESIRGALKTIFGPGD